MTPERQSCPLPLVHEELTSYAGTHKRLCTVARPVSVEDCVQLVEWCRVQRRQLCPRGSGLSYGDSSLHADAIVVDLRNMNAITRWDMSLGVLTAEAGTTLAAVMETTLPDNWNLTAIPGTGELTVGGAIANDVHGKDGTHVGNFNDQIISMDLITPDGRIVKLTPKDHSLFQATIGGLGLTGIIVRATLQLKAVPSPYIRTQIRMTQNLEATCTELKKAATESNFAIAWLDAFARGKSLGRGYVQRGNWDDAEAVDAQSPAPHYEKPTRVFGLIPVALFWPLVRPFFNRISFRVVNALYFTLMRSRHGKSPQSSRLHFFHFNFLHNQIPEFRQIYGARGFVEIQPLIPEHHGARGIAQVLELCQRHGKESYLCGLKYHNTSGGMLSFAGKGFSFGIDIAMSRGGQAKMRDFLDELFALLRSLGASVHLAKDHSMTREDAGHLIEERERFMDIRRELDPDCMLVSDMSERLF